MRRILILCIAVLAALVMGLIGGLWLADETHKAAGPPLAGAISSNKSTPTAATVKRKILYWWDPMVGASSISKKPGISSMGMKLIPVYASAGKPAPAGQVRVDPAMVQDMGIQIGKVMMGPLMKTIRAVGYLKVVAPERYSVTLRAGGWIGKLYATTNGTAITTGEKLFTLYSPVIVTAQEELIAARKALLAVKKTHDAGASRDAGELVRSIEHRLKFLGVNRAQIQAIEKSLHARTYIIFYSPASGALADVTVQQKSRIKAGTTAMRIENLSALWLDTHVYENQLPWIRMGQRVTATIAALPGRTFAGKIIFIDPFQNSQNHTTTIRIVLDNSSGQLRPGMYALTDIHTRPVQRAILAPRVAVLNTGTSEIAFVEVSHGHFDPVTVKTGLSGKHGLVQILSGLKPGQKVVTSGQFLMDVESQLNQIKARFMPKLPPTGKAKS